MILPTVGGGMGFFGPGNSSYAIYPPAGSDLYGHGHAACGLTAARNGIVLYERGSGRAEPVLVVEHPVSGWTHVAVRYEEGVPTVFVDGVPVGTGTASGNTVHPGLDIALPSDGATEFWGDTSGPQLHAGAMDDSAIRELASAGIPSPEGPPGVELSGNGKSRELLLWQDGAYSIERNDGQFEEFLVTGAGKVADITAPWDVRFPPGLGAPERIAIPKLMSLHRHADEGVRYFSGTATYANTFGVEPGLVGDGRKLYLDLGRVEVLARVMVNGKDLGILWARPYRIDVTEAVREGENRLVIAVTNLWPNRLIGDEQLPEEYAYESGGSRFGASGGRIAEMPGWFSRGEPRPSGERIAFTTYRHYSKDSPLLESGLIGPVRLLAARVRKLTSS
jgi:hypothetical protein